MNFALENNEVHVFEDESDVPADEIWYIGDDYGDMKVTSRFEAKEFRRMGFGLLLKDTFAYPRPDAQEFINAFVQLESSQTRRGLERQLCRSHGEERSELKDRARQSVMIHQRRLRREGLKPDEIAEKLGSMYREVTRSASVFARRMALADEHFTHYGEDNSAAQKLMEGYKGNRRMSMERRFSNCSMISTHSFNSQRRPVPNGTTRRGSLKNCPSSPASPTEEFYAAIA